MLQLVQLEELRVLLLRVPGLVNLLESKDHRLSGEVKDWLSSIETALGHNRLPATARVASLRALLIGAERGEIPSELCLRDQPARRAIRDAAASYAIRAASEAVGAAIGQDVARVAEAERCMQQLVVLGKRRGVLPDTTSFADLTEALRTTWDMLCADPELSAGTTNIESLVEASDALVLLDRALARLPM